MYIYKYILILIQYMGPCVFGSPDYIVMIMTIWASSYYH